MKVAVQVETENMSLRVEQQINEIRSVSQHLPINLEQHFEDTIALARSATLPDAIAAQPIDRDELKAVVMSCGEDPAPAELADVITVWLAAAK